jgi:hypothetical protein
MRVLQKAALLAIAAACLAWTAEAVPITYRANLSGPAESPPVDSPGTGSTRVTIDTDANTFHVSFVFADLLAPTTVAHIHGPTLVPFEGTASVMTTTPSFPGFPAGVTSGSYDQSFDLTDAGTYNPAFVTAQGGVPQAEAALAAALAEGRAYLNIHSELFPSGEIRGFLTPIPLPAGLPLLLAGLLALGWAGGARRSV